MLIRQSERQKPPAPARGACWGRVTIADPSCRSAVIVLRHLLDKHRHVLWQSLGLAFQADTQPITYFLADGCTANAVDLNIIPNDWTGHESFPASRGRH